MKTTSLSKTTYYDIKEKQHARRDVDSKQYKRGIMVPLRHVSLLRCVHNNIQCWYPEHAVWSTYQCPQSRGNERQWGCRRNTGADCVTPPSHQPCLSLPHVHTSPPQKPHLLTCTLCDITWCIEAWQRGLSQAFKSSSFPYALSHFQKVIQRLLLY